MATAPIPIIDVGDPGAAAALRAACLEHGFFVCTGHGIPPALVAHMFDRCRALFALPVEQKRAMLQDANNRGWTPLGEETLDPEHQTRGDTKEGFYFGRDVPADDPEAELPLHGPNVWPPEGLVPGFRAAAEEYMRRLTDLGRRLVRLVAESLGLPADHFDPAFTRPMTFLRPLRYAREPSAPAAGVVGAGAHTDYGMLTLLATDGRPGLQVFLPAPRGSAGEGEGATGHSSTGGVWADVPPVAAPDTGAFVVNIGDMLERWTNGLYRSTLHRVVISNGSGDGGGDAGGDAGNGGGGKDGSGCGERFSIPFFFEPNFDAVVEALPCCVPPGSAPRFPPTTAGRHLLDRYAATHAGYNGGAAAAAAAEVEETEEDEKGSKLVT